MLLLKYLSTKGTQRANPLTRDDRTKGLAVMFFCRFTNGTNQTQGLQHTTELSYIKNFARLEAATASVSS